MTTMLLGKKIGMTRVYNDKGVIEPVTVIQAGPCTVMQVKSAEGKDGYSAIQLGIDDVKPSRRKKPAIGHAKKANATVKRFVREARLESDSDLELGAEVNVSVFEGVNYVDITGTTKGKGYAGVVKRHGFKGMGMGHGVERKHRHPGGIGSNSGSAGTGRGIRKGKKMAGHLGNVSCTSRHHKIVDIDVENNLLLVKGPVAGARNGMVVIKKSKVKQ